MAIVPLLALTAAYEVAAPAPPRAADHDLRLDQVRHQLELTFAKRMRAFQRKD